jgi:two-component system CheB/CheR fusion protein
MQQDQEKLTAEINELRCQLDEANDTIHAIRTGLVDAFVVQGAEGNQLYTLKNTDQTFRVLIEKMQEGAITLNKEGVILYCNSCFAQMTGVALDKVIGRHFNTFIKGYTAGYLSNIASEGQFTDYKIEDVLLGPNEENIPVLLSLTNLNLEDGTALSIICTDITAQKEAQRKSADIEAQRELMDRKDEFIGIASHELKTPLTSLKAYIQLIAKFDKGNLPPQIRTFIGKAETSIDKLQNLINDLLDVSKIQAGKLHFDLLPLSVNNLVSTCADNAAYMFPDYLISFKAKEDFVIDGSAERLEQVLMNIINNAVKYSPVNKNIILSVDREDNRVKISVTDFGIGLSLEQQEKIFERFYRVDEMNFTASGLGMGLFIAKEIIKSHNGTMGVTSNINNGATFYVHLPIAEPKSV